MGLQLLISGQGHNLMVLRLSLTLGSVPSMEPALDSLSPTPLPLHYSLTCACTCALSPSQKIIKINKNTRFQSTWNLKDFTTYIMDFMSSHISFSVMWLSFEIVKDIRERSGYDGQLGNTVTILPGPSQTVYVPGI